MTFRSAEELKRLLIEAFSSTGDVHLDLEQAEEIDVAVLQLLWAAGREAGRTGTGIVSLVSEAAKAAARDAGFGPIPGAAMQD